MITMLLELSQGGLITQNDEIRSQNCRQKVNDASCNLSRFTRLLHSATKAMDVKAKDNLKGENKTTQISPSRREFLKHCIN